MDNRWRLVLRLWILSVLIGATIALATAPAIPDPGKTPGATDGHCTKALACRHGYAATVRHVTPAVKRRVCLAYGIKKGCPGPGYEIDHLVSLELCGANVDANLWPQPIAEARIKDATEDHLHAQVCAGKLTLERAQALIKDPSQWTTKAK